MARITIGCIHIFLNQRVVYIVLYIYVLYRSMRYIVLCIYTYITVSLYRHLYLLSTEILIWAPLSVVWPSRMHHRFSPPPALVAIFSPAQARGMKGAVEWARTLKRRGRARRSRAQIVWNNVCIKPNTCHRPNAQPPGQVHESSLFQCVVLSSTNRLIRFACLYPELLFKCSPSSTTVSRHQRPCAGAASESPHNAHRWCPYSVHARSRRNIAPFLCKRCSRIQAAIRTSSEYIYISIYILIW